MLDNYNATLLKPIQHKLGGGIPWEVYFFQGLERIMLLTIFWSEIRKDKSRDK